MSKKNVGFTLIELLTVIVILAIIALIAVPIVINIINDAKIESQKRSIQTYVDTVQKRITGENMKIKYDPDSCDILSNGNIKCYKEKEILKTSKGDYELEIEMNGRKLESGTLYILNGKIISGKNLLISGKYFNIENDGKITEIKSKTIAYFKEYDGSDNFIGFDKNNIESFSRNTDLTKEEVLEKENVQLISNTVNDDYKSKYEVYGWIEENNFYWWSEADVVYFHPKTKSGFRRMQNIVSIDLTDTNTSLVENFSNWFYNDEELTNIIGKINTKGLKYEIGTDVAFKGMFSECKKLIYLDVSEFDTRNATSFETMFHNCKKLLNLDLSKFNTSNAIKMNGMFNGCNALKKIDLSSFNTSNVTDMRSMFTSCHSILSLDLSNFDTSSVTDMRSMFSYCKNLKIIDISSFDTGNVIDMKSMFENDLNNSLSYIVLGDKFDTSNVTNMNNMFKDSKNLKAVYVKKNFVMNPDVVYENMFYRNDNIVGGYLSEYTTTYDSSNLDGTYAKISNENNPGYFTYYDSINNLKANIVYSLDGGIADNVNIYYKFDSSFTLNYPIKEGYIFVGWTGSNGNNPELNVSLSEEIFGNKHYTANYIKGDEFNILGPCSFNGGTSNITGDNCRLLKGTKTVVDYTRYKYINTGLTLFDSHNIDKDFEISFTIDSIDQYENNSTIISSMNESGTPWPGFVYRINTSTSKLNLRAGYNGNTNWEIPYTSRKIKIVRKNKILYYSVDDGNLIPIVDFNNFTSTFDYPLTIGAGLDENKNPRRYFKGTLSNISIKINN